MSAAPLASGAPVAAVPAGGDAASATRRARGELDAAVIKAGLEDDPLRHVLGALSSSLGALEGVQASIEAMRRPMDTELRTALLEAHGDAMRREAKRLVQSQLRRNLLFAGVAGLAVSGLIAAAGAGGYAWGRSTEAARSREVGGALAASLRDGSASGQRWMDLMHGNDILAALQRCDGNSVAKDAAGRRACAVPLWIDPPNTSGAPPVLAGRRP